MFNSKMFRKNKTINFYRMDPRNIGDKYSSPYKYFHFLKGTKRADIAPRRFRKFLPQLKGKVVIIGGGGLIGHPYFKPKVEAIIKSKAKNIIFWGAGHNIHAKKDIIMPDYLKVCDLVGVRDFGFGYQWVPCPSCLHQAFNKRYTTKHKIIVYENTHFNKLSIDGFPKLGNNVRKFEDVIEFLGSGEIILSSSYHGIYWGTLLNKKVIAINPFSSKFYGLKYKVPLATYDNWHNKIDEARNYPHALSECREANHLFSKKVQDLIE